MNIHGKRILLTGATGGLGQELACLLAQKGAVLTLVGRDEHKLNLLKIAIEKNGSQVYCQLGDLAHENAINSIVMNAKKSMGGIDILINNAGTLDFIKFEKQTKQRIAEIMQTNVTAPIQLTQAVITEFQAKDAGHIVFVGSIFGSLGYPHFSTYCASKFAIHGFSQALRRELIGSKIGITYIAPRGINTAMNDLSTLAMWKSIGSTLDEPVKVAKCIVRALESEQQEVFIGLSESFFAWINGLFPRIVSAGLKTPTIIARRFL